MITTEQIAQMSREEKLQAMEALWADLSRNAAEVESPPWHEEALKETAARVADGKALIAEWEEAKRELRNRFE
ncbi:MAG TPA: addiction module protein [Candidatus Hydrogenedentes bacterium]|nr:addiction module protein [Candidatus Hydrogenedentota bacterium]HNT86261.1 addiction module protein [Candidatus Hydrogenedentota bacterium]